MIPASLLYILLYSARKIQKNAPQDSCNAFFLLIVTLLVHTLFGNVLRIVFFFLLFHRLNRHFFFLFIKIFHIFLFIVIKFDRGSLLVQYNTIKKYCFIDFSTAQTKIGKTHML